MIVFVADLHLTPTIWADLPNVRDDAYRALQHIITYCKNNHAEALIFGGDIFDKSTPDSLSVTEFHKQLRRLDSSTQIFAIQGQHDRSSPPWFALNHRIVHLDEYKDGTGISLKIDGVTFKLIGFDNTDAETVSERLEGLKDNQCEILVMHQALKQLFSVDDRWNLDEQWIPDFVKLVLLGDLHIAASSGICHYSGSTHMRSMSENPQKSFITVAYADGELQVTRQPIPSRPITVTSITSEDELVELLNQIKDMKMDSLLLTRVDSNLIDAYQRITAVCKEAMVHVRIRDLPIKEVVDQSAQPAPTDIGLEQCVSLVVDREKKPELHAILLRLLASPQAKEELATIRSEFGISG